MNDLNGGKPRMIEFGVYTQEGDARAILGDGLTAVQSLGMTDGTAGIVICRDGKQNEPFGLNEKSDTYKSKEDKIYILASSKRSIQVLIDRLEEAKLFLDC